MPRVTAVICAYWKERSENVGRIIRDMQAGSVAPDRIIVLNNNDEDPDYFNYLTDFYGVSVLRGANTECRGKFVAALFEPADAYLLNDDDTSVGPRTLETLVAHLERGFVTGYWGVVMRDGVPFGRGQILGPGNITEPRPVQAFHGRSMFMAHDALVRMLAVEEWCREEGSEMVGDDILAGLANPGSCLVPMTGDAAFVDLSECGVSMQGRPGYFDDRDRFSLAAQRAIDRHGIPTW